MAMANFFEEVWLPHKSPRLTDGPQGALYEYLLYYDPEDNFKLKPGLAESWSQKDFSESPSRSARASSGATARAKSRPKMSRTRSRPHPRRREVHRYAVLAPRAKNMQVTDKYTLTFKLDTVDTSAALPVEQLAPHRHHAEGVHRVRRRREGRA